jgi:hypothetical protein
MNICGHCVNKGKKDGCMMCGRKRKFKKPQKTDREIVKEQRDKERLAFFKKMKEGMETFKLHTTGAPEVDAEIRRLASEGSI